MTHGGSDETAVKTAVEDLLEAMGSYDIESLRDGTWVTSTMRFERFLAGLESETDPTHYTEPVTEFTVHIDDAWKFVNASYIGTPPPRLPW